MLKNIRIILVIYAMLILTGCATAADVELSDSYWKTPQQKTGIAIIKNEKPQLYKAGAQGLIDIAINSAMTSTFNHRINIEDISWYHSLPSRFESELRKRGVAAVIYPQDLTDSKPNYPFLAQKMHANNILVFNLQAVGAIRKYYGFIPLGAPQAYCVLSGELVNVQTNKVLWRHGTEIVEKIDGEWDQPPTYPNFEKALKTAMKSAQEEIVASFFSGH